MNCTHTFQLSVLVASLTALSASDGAAADEKPGSFSGTVVYDGAAPKVGKPAAFKPNDPKTDKFCIKHAKAIVDGSLIVNPRTKGLANAVVYFVGKPPAGYKPKPLPKDPVTFTNDKCSFVPRVLVARVGQEIKIANDDATAHNVHTYPLSPENSGYNQVLAKGKSETLKYAGWEPLPVKVGCDIHAWMTGYHVVLGHDMVALTDKDGKFQIDGIPPGTHNFRIWHEKAGYLERSLKITVKAGEAVTKDFSYKPEAFAGLERKTPPSANVAAGR